MKWFDYARPGSLAEALELLAAHPGALPLVGGTDLLVQMRTGRKQTGFVVDLKRVPELNAIEFDPAKGLRLGAAVPCCRIYEHRAILRTYPALAEVAALIGGTQIQSRASIGGNLCNAAPSADAVPVLIASNAVCHIAGPGGLRTIPVEDFCTAPGSNVLRAGELLVEFSIPSPEARSGVRYLRFTPRNEMDIAVAGAAVSVSLENGNFRAARIALSAVAPTPLLVRQASGLLAGQPVAQETIAAAAKLAGEAARPITDMRGSAEYRRHLSAVLTRRALESAILRARGEN